MNWYRTDRGYLVNLELAQRIFYNAETDEVVAGFADDGDGLNDEDGNAFILLRDCNKEQAQAFIDKLHKKLS